MKKLIAISALLLLVWSCETVSTLPPVPASCKACIDSVLPAIIDSIQNDIEFQVLNTSAPEPHGFMAAPATSRTAAILHVIALNSKVSIKRSWIMTLPENYATDTSFAGQLTRQLKYMNQQGSHGAEYPSKIYPHDTIFNNRQGKICEIWIAQTQAQINNGSKEWIENTLDRGYATHTLEMENSRGRKLIYPNQ